MLTSPVLAAQPDLIDLSMANAGIVALLGYAMVFAGLIVLMAVVMIIGKIFSAQNKKQSAPAAVAAPAVTASPAAPGSAGELKLYNVEPKTAAMVMAIVAERTGKPLNELRFLSIKEVE